MAVSRRAVPAASNYPQYSGNLISPIVSSELIGRFHEATIFKAISNTNYIGQLTKGGDQITFYREPVVTVHDHIKDGKIKHDVIETESFTLVVDKAKRFSVKIDRVDEFQMQNLNSFRDAFLRNAANSLAEQVDRDILSTVYTKVDAANSGTNAGVESGAYNMGTLGNPVTITAANFDEVLFEVGAVLSEWSVPTQNRFVVMPTVGVTVGLNSDFRRADITGMNRSEPLMNGQLPATPAGLNLFQSNHVQRVWDPGVNAWCYHVLAGIPSATVFASQIQETRIMEDVDTWDRYYQGLAVYGFDVVQPEGLVDLYCRFA